MFPRVVGVRHVHEYALEIKFSDDTTATVDLRHRIFGRGGVFQPLQEIKYFARVEVDQEGGTLVWPNGVDLCPDVLYAEATGKKIDEMGDESRVA